jgi:translation elongation factor EF-Tu-like GTPase
MMKKILTVEDTFLITGRGLVAAGWEDEYPNVKHGEEVEIVHPDGTKIETRVFWEFIRRLNPIETEKKPVGLLLKDLEKKDVPKGSVIYALESKTN